MSQFTIGTRADVPNAEYHADTEWLSSTTLKRALPAYTEPDDEAALIFGSLFHTTVLEPEKVATEYVVLDPNEIGVKADGSPAANPTATSAWKAAVAEAKAAGQVIVSKDNIARAEAMAEQVWQHKTAASLLFHGQGANEESAFWIEDGIKHKARFDRRIPGAIVDLKSTSTRLDSESLAKSCAEYLYDLSAVHYLAGAEALDLNADAFAWVFVSKKAPHHVVVAEPDAAFLADGRTLRRQAIDRITNGPRGHVTLSPPRWRVIEGAEA